MAQFCLDQHNTTSRTAKKASPGLTTTTVGGSASRTRQINEMICVRCSLVDSTPPLGRHSSVVVHPFNLIHIEVSTCRLTLTPLLLGVWFQEKDGRLNRNEV